MSYTICPICGADVSHADRFSLIATSERYQHRCRKKVLDGIDGAMQNDEPRERTPSFAERLKDGFRMMGCDE